MSRSLSGAQFRDVAYEERTGFGTWYVVAEQPLEQEKTGDLRGITVSLQHPHTDFYYDQSDVAHEANWDTRTESYRYGPERVWDSDGNVVGHQGTLFGYRHERPVVNWIKANDEYRHYAASLLGVAAQESMTRFGEYPVSDDQLSIHSGRIVSRLARAGAVEQPAWQPYSDVDFDEWPSAYLPDDKPVPKMQPWRLAAGRRLIGQALRGSDSSPPAVDFKGQQSLFDT